MPVAPLMRPMSAFDPAKPALLHDRLNDKIIPWTGELKENWLANARPHAEDVVAWDGLLFDGWDEPLGG
jgi:hypothetical protein